MAKNYTSPLADLIALEQDARAFGFDWPDKKMIIDQAISECTEIHEAIQNQESPERLQEEIGDLLHTAISLCIFAGFEVDETLTKVTQKFGRRMAALKILTQQQGLSHLQGQNMAYMLGLWQTVKKQE